MRLRARERVYVRRALFVLVHAYLYVIGLYEMEKAGAGLYRAGVVVR